MGWDKFYLNPEWIEENVCAYIQEAQYSTIAHSSYAEGIKECDLGKWLSLLKGGRGSWWYNVRVSPVSSYQGNFELEGSLLDSNSEAPTPEILLTKEVERIERFHRFFCNTTWEKMYVDESPDCKDTSAWYVERCKASLREEDPETDLEEMLYILNGCEHPSAEQAEILKQKLFSHHETGQLLFENNCGTLSFEDAASAKEEYKRRHSRFQDEGKRDLPAEEAPAEA